jgi:RNA polymerase sigma-70 factor (ECF subfamily)
MVPVPLPENKPRPLKFDKHVEPFPRKWHIHVMNDSELAAGLSNGSRNALEEIVDLYGDRLLRSAFILCNNETEAKDLVQETFVQAIQSAGTFQRRTALYTWLPGLLLNLTRHHIRKQQKLDYVENIPEPEPDRRPETSPLDLNSASELLLSAIRQLSFQHREAVVLRYYQGMPLETIAEQTGVSLGTVKSRLFYALRELRKKLPGEMNLFSARGTY